MRLIDCIKKYEGLSKQIEQLKDQARSAYYEGKNYNSIVDKIVILSEQRLNYIYQ